ncbi:hypothetical protein AFLA70_74g003241 [Aspergillus flavus AF70]|nr:hypothetical protein AFLA70_74g003241 [Aspergillus flavus AF70]
MSNSDPNDVFPPGTTKLEERQGVESEFKLSPTPSDDPDDPLNWSPLRKAVNFGLTCSYVLFTFVLVDINSLAYRGYMSELGLTYATFNQASGSNFAGLAIGCLLFIPCLACAIWWANFHKAGELIGVSLLAGLAGSISEAVVMITIVDHFFVHQHARMNGIFLFMQSLGSTGGPIAAGYIVVSMGWRWMWWMIAIFLGVNLILVLFFFEEPKYIPLVVGHFGRSGLDQESAIKNDDDQKIATPSTLRVATRSTVDARHSRKTVRQRLAFVTKTDMPIVQHFYQPLLILFSFPAVAYMAITYGTILACASAIGLFHLGEFLGTFIATLTVPAQNDWFIGMHWAMLAVDQGIYGVGYITTADVALTYLTDCYPDILGDALNSIVFVRNGFAMVVRFAFTPWVTGMGIQNSFILISMLALLTVTLPILLMIYGKRARASTADKYWKYAARQPVHRKA